MSRFPDTSLDDFIFNRRSAYERRSHNLSRHASSTSSHGAIRHSFVYEPIRPDPCPMPLPMPMVPPEPERRQSGRSDEESGIKLYISNLDYRVSERDILLLFSNIGELESYSIHYDSNGRSKGTAEVIFARQQDALRSIHEYNNSLLDGKRMKVELVGADVLIPTPVNTERPYDMPRSGQGSYAPRVQESYAPTGWGNGGVCNQGSTRGQGQVRRRPERVTAEELDTDLEMYHLKGKRIN